MVYLVRKKENELARQRLPNLVPHIPRPSIYGNTSSNPSNVGQLSSLVVCGAAGSKVNVSARSSTAAKPINAKLVSKYNIYITPRMTRKKGTIRVSCQRSCPARHPSAP